MVPQDRWVLYVLFFLSLTNFSLLISLTYSTLSIALRILYLFTLDFPDYLFILAFLEFFFSLSFVAIVSLSLSLDVFTLTFQSFLLCYFSPQQIIFTFTHHLFFSHLRVFRSLLAWWYDCSGWTSLFSDAFPSSLSSFFPYISTQVYIISPLSYILYHLSGKFSAIISFVKSVNETSTPNHAMLLALSLMPSWPFSSNWVFTGYPEENCDLGV